MGYIGRSIRLLVIVVWFGRGLVGGLVGHLWRVGGVLGLLRCGLLCLGGLGGSSVVSPFVGFGLFTWWLSGRVTLVPVISTSMLRVILRV